MAKEKDCCCEDSLYGGEPSVFCDAVKSIENRREFIKKVLKPAEDASKELAKATVGDKVRLQGTKETKAPKLKPYTESVNVRSRKELTPLIDEAKRSNRPWKVERCKKEGYRYTFFTKVLKEAKEVNLDDMFDVAPDIEAEPIEAPIDTEIKDEPKPEEEKELTPCDVWKNHLDIKVNKDKHSASMCVKDCEEEDCCITIKDLTDEELEVLCANFDCEEPKEDKDIKAEDGDKSEPIEESCKVKEDTEFKSNNTVNTKVNDLGMKLSETGEIFKVADTFDKFYEKYKEEYSDYEGDSKEEVKEAYYTLMNFIFNNKFKPSNNGSLREDLDFKIGDKVIYLNSYDKKYYNKVATIVDIYYPVAPKHPVYNLKFEDGNVFGTFGGGIKHTTTKEESLNEDKHKEESTIEADKVETTKCEDGECKEKTEIFTELPDFDVEVEQKGDKVEVEITPKDKDEDDFDDEDFIDDIEEVDFDFDGDFGLEDITKERPEEVKEESLNESKGEIKPTYLGKSKLENKMNEDIIPVESLRLEKGDKVKYLTKGDEYFGEEATIVNIFDSAWNGHDVTQYLIPFSYLIEFNDGEQREVKPNEISSERAEKVAKEWQDVADKASKRREMSEASSAMKKAYRNGGEAYTDLEVGRAIGRIQDKNSRDAAIASLKANRPEVAKDNFIGDRKLRQSGDKIMNKMSKMQKAGYPDTPVNEAIDDIKTEDSAVIDDNVEIKLDDLQYFKPVAGARETWKMILDNNKLPEFVEVLKDFAKDGKMVTSDLNEMLWFEKEYIFDKLGINPKTVTPREDDVDVEAEEVSDKE